MGLDFQFLDVLHCLLQERWVDSVSCIERFFHLL